ncbi:hypothetical protein AJ78_04087 [Emergomyces pasteurianus Ep9510]|uniref:Myb-like DNA-binding domain-containing protein n=1 Tax=Emergomyces pasteurianus Ep9510 TaxID=1447872 RepID=A0A1J9QKF3_9EURO|nr:hypothetical protein AJ78_04087 [Emergomyces pasteurianus Ep9510]
MPADGQTAKFLYTMLKQLDLKSIDWNLVASQLEISNGHAARMRFSRFRQHMEGISTTHRTKKPKVDKAQLKKLQQNSEPKREPTVKTERIVKQEPDREGQSANETFMPMDMMLTPASSCQRSCSVTTVAPADLALPSPPCNPPVGFPRSTTIAEWSQIKMEK